MVRVSKSLYFQLDHVALILRSEEEPNEVFLLRVQDEGKVNIRKWSRIKGEYGSFFEKLVYRKLIWQRPEFAIQGIQNFVDSIIQQGFSESVVIGTDLPRKVALTSELILRAYEAFKLI